MLVICAALIIVLGLFITAVGIATLAATPVAGLLVLAGVAPIAALGALIVGETRAAFRLRIALTGDAVELRLPRRRGHVQHPDVSDTVPLGSVDRIETRAEAFRQLGITTIQQAYRLVLKDDRAIDLGADREMKGDLFGRAAEAIAARLNLQIQNLGMVDGAPGFLAVYGTSAPPWGAASLDETEIAKRIAARTRAYQWMAASATLVMLARLIARR